MPSASVIPQSPEVELEDLRCIDVAAVAHLLGKSTSHIYALIHGGDPTFPFVRVGSGYSIPVHRFRAWHARGGTPTAQDNGQPDEARACVVNPRSATRTAATARRIERSLDDVMPWRRALR